MVRFIYPLFIFLIITLTAGNGFSKPKYFFKIGSIAPEGSVWIDQFREFTKEVKEKTNGEVGFKIYPGGVMGDDQAMLRKMRVGQLHGGGFTMTGVSELVNDFRILAIPFLFTNYEEIDHLKTDLQPYLEKQFRKKRMEFMAYNEVGFVYAMSTKPIKTVDDLKNAKSWTPSGDPLTENFMKAIDITPIQLTIPDVLSSLQTGLIDTAFNSLYGTIVLQWFTKANHITDIPYGYAYGVFVLDKKAYSKLPKEYAAIVKEAAEKHFDIIGQKTRQSNQDSRKVLADQGVQFIEPDPGVLEAMQGFRDQAVEQSVGKAFSKEVYEMMVNSLEAYKSKQ